MYRGSRRRHPSTAVADGSAEMPNLCSRACGNRREAGASFQAMTHLRCRPFAIAAVVLAAMVMTACGSTGTPQDGRYLSHDGGRSYFRA